MRIGNLEDIGTIVCDEDEIVEQQVVSGIAYAKDEAKVTILRSRTSRAWPRAFSGRSPKPTSTSI